MSEMNISAIVAILKEIDEIDTILQHKYERNNNDVQLYQSLLDSSNKYFNIIIKNLNV